METNTIKTDSEESYDLSQTLFGVLMFTGFVWYIKFLWGRRNLYLAARKLHGPAGYPFIGIALQFVGSPELIFTRLRQFYKEYDPDFKIWFGHRLFYCISKPENLEIVMNNQNCLEKEELYKFTRLVVGTGLFSAPVKKWKKNRKIITPTFNPKILDSFVPVFAEQSTILVDTVLKKYAGKGEFKAYEIFTSTSLDIICETAMGVKVSAQTTESEFGKWVDIVMMVVFLRMFVLYYQPDFLFNMTKLSKKFDDAVFKMKEFTTKVVREKKAKFDERLASTKGEWIIDDGVQLRKAFLDHLLDLTYQGIKFTEQELCDEVSTFLVGGSDTTATTMCFCFTMFGMHPEYQQKVYDEVIEVLGHDRPVTAEDLPKLKYLERFIKETLRLFPPAAFVVKAVKGDIQLDGYNIPENSSVLLGFMQTHRNPKYWEDPLKFDPDRFLPEVSSKRHQYAFVPFSGGPRGCIGQRYSYMALKSVLSMAIRKYKVSSSYKSIEEIELKTNLVLRPTKGFKVSVEERQN